MKLSTLWKGSRAKVAKPFSEPVRKGVFFLLCIQTDADFWDVQCHNTDLSRDMQHTSHGKGIPE